MHREDLERLTVAELRSIAKQYQVEYKALSKNALINNILERYCDIKKYISYHYIQQLGYEGKDGRAFLVRSNSGTEYAMKVFRLSKRKESLEREVQLQMKAAAHGLAPVVHEYDLQGKFIVMDRLDTTLYDTFRKQKGVLSLAQQRAVIRLFQGMDKCGVFHADPNPLNFMKKGRKWFLIDYGFAKPINQRIVNKYGPTPNITYMPMGFLIQMRKIVPDCRLEIIEQYCQQFQSKNDIAIRNII